MVRRSARALSLWFILPTALASSALANPPDNPDTDDEMQDPASCPLLDQGDLDDAGDIDDLSDQPQVVMVKPDVVGDASSLEKAILEETNVLRRDPRGYANKLIQLRPSYQGKIIHRPGQVSILTQEGVAALDEAIEALQRAPKRLSRLAHAEGLSRAARDHALDLGRTGALGHIGSDGFGPDVRAKRHGTWDGMVAENIAFGPTEAEEIVIGLLVDDGVKDRGHREILLTHDLYFAGAACGPHPSYGTTCVMTYATTFQTRGATARAPVAEPEPEPVTVTRPAPDPWQSPKAPLADDELPDPVDVVDPDIAGLDLGTDDDEPDTDRPAVLDSDDTDDSDDSELGDDAWQPEPRRPRVVQQPYGPGYYPAPGYYPGPRYRPGPRYYPSPRSYYGPRAYYGPRPYRGPRYYR